jgi:hypothetical protein
MIRLCHAKLSHFEISLANTALVLQLESYRPLHTLNCDPSAKKIFKRGFFQLLTEASQSKTALINHERFVDAFVRNQPQALSANRYCTHAEFGQHSVMSKFNNKYITTHDFLRFQENLQWYNSILAGFNQAPPPQNINNNPLLFPTAQPAKDNISTTKENSSPLPTTPRAVVRAFPTSPAPPIPPQEQPGSSNNQFFSPLAQISLPTVQSLTQTHSKQQHRQYESQFTKQLHQQRETNKLSSQPLPPHQDAPCFDVLGLTEHMNAHPRDSLKSEPVLQPSLLDRFQNHPRTVPLSAQSSSALQNTHSARERLDQIQHALKQQHGFNQQGFNLLNKD